MDFERLQQFRLPVPSSLRRQIVFLIAVLLLLSAGCRRHEQDRASAPVASIEKSSLVDSPENRRREAQKCIEAYPLKEFGAELTEQAAEMTGREVAEDARMRLKQRLTADEFERVRLEMLVEHFSAEELAELAEIYSTGEGRSLIRKLCTYNEKWREYLSPIILEALTQGDTGS